MGEQDAEFLVRACNSHYELVEACRAAISIVQAEAKTCTNHQGALYAQETWMQLEKALDLAEGKEGSDEQE